MTFTQYYDKFIDKLKADFEQAKLLDASKPFNYQVALTDTIIHGKEITTPEDMKEALDDYNKQAPAFSSKYITVTTELNYEVDGHEEDGYIEVNSVYTTLQTKAVRPKTQDEFDALLKAEITMKCYFKLFMTDIIYKHQKAINTKSDIGIYPPNNIDCKLLDLFKQEIINFDQLVKAVYSNC